ncbi:MAG: hypothetical protein PVSMB6_01980 [Steroidobacteraceae bacterium]
MFVLKACFRVAESSARVRDKGPGGRVPIGVADLRGQNLRQACRCNPASGLPKKARAKA